ncbi:hypothetical protein HK100_008207 [Physocladia obscura]|uniref:CN hydrolase domain-containing protein n=1 Tax=Physocladia obscura TaxID=109957 RepID=A0AAD5XFK8_9FUNG|nr:hypothetical protein HK100_008207 [Physocladia obscura]
MIVDWFLLGGILVSAAFGAGIQPVPMLGILYFPLLSLYFEVGRLANAKTWKRFLLAVLFSSLGMFVAFIGALNDDDANAFSADCLVVLGYAFVVACLVLTAAIAQKAIRDIAIITTVTAGAASKSSWFLPILVFLERVDSLVYAAGWAGVWRLIYTASPFGSLGHPALLVVYWSDILQLASIFGHDGVVFLFAWGGAAIAHILVSSPFPANVNNTSESTGSGNESHNNNDLLTWGRFRKTIQTSLGAFLFTLILIGIIGGFRVSSWGAGGTFFQQSISQHLPDKTIFGCVITDGSATDPAPIFARSQVLANNNARVILWNEESVQIIGTTAEALLQTNASHFAEKNNLLLGITYEVFDDASMAASRNMFVVFDVSGAQVITYQKSDPVPLVEAGVVAGPRIVPTVNLSNFTTRGSSTYNVGGGICFDVSSFPMRSELAGRLGVDIMLQPAWTWGAIANFDFPGAIITTVEAGYTLLRCSSRGFSGVIDGYGRVLYSLPVGKDEEFLVTVPITKRVFALYPYFGFLFGWMCLAIYLSVWGLILATWRKDFLARGGKKVLSAYTPTVSV